MHLPAELLENNRRWAGEIIAKDPRFFENLSKGQRPEVLWIGCSDSRVPATQLLGLQPGMAFVHRNIANVVAHGDLNCLSVMEYAVSVLKVKHIIVCGHYGCGGVKAATGDTRVGLIDNWLRHIRDVRRKHADELAAITDENRRFDRLCELNTIEQAGNVCSTSVVQEAWERDQPLAVHGWMFRLSDGLITDLRVTATGLDEVDEAYLVAAKDTSKLPKMEL